MWALPSSQSVFVWLSVVCSSIKIWNWLTRHYGVWLDSFSSDLFLAVAYFRDLSLNLNKVKEKLKAGEPCCFSAFIVQSPAEMKSRVSMTTCKTTMFANQCNSRARKPAKMSLATPHILICLDNKSPCKWVEIISGKTIFKSSNNLPMK